MQSNTDSLRGVWLQTLRDRAGGILLQYQLNITKDNKEDLKAMVFPLEQPMIEVPHSGFSLYSSIVPSRRKEEEKDKKNNIRDSNVVPHRSTNLTRRCLTSLSGREAVLSSWYGRSCKRWLQLIYNLIKKSLLFKTNNYFSTMALTTNLGYTMLLFSSVSKQ